MFIASCTIGDDVATTPKQLDVSKNGRVISFEGKCRKIAGRPSLTMGDAVLYRGLVLPHESDDIDTAFAYSKLTSDRADHIRGKAGGGGGTGHNFWRTQPKPFRFLKDSMDLIRDYSGTPLQLKGASSPGNGWLYEVYLSPLFLPMGFKSTRPDQFLPSDLGHSHTVELRLAYRRVVVDTSCTS